MDKNQVEWNGKTAQNIIENLEKRRLEGSYASTAAEALEQVLAMIPRGSWSIAADRSPRPRWDYGKKWPRCRE